VRAHRHVLGGLIQQRASHRIFLIAVFRRVHAVLLSIGTVVEKSPGFVFGLTSLCGKGRTECSVALQFF
jgi:hypothetical protein